MSDVIWANNAGATLAAAITSSQTSITVTSGSGALFPSPSGAQFFPLTLMSQSNSTIFEIVYCTSRSSDTLTVTRAQEGTAAQAFNAGDFARLLPTAATLSLGFPTGLGTLTTNTTVTGTAAGTYYNINGSSVAVTITATTFAAGQTIGFLARTACTVATSSGTFYGGSLSGSSLAMPAGSFVALEWDGVNWRQLAGSFVPSPSSLTANGWKKYPDSTSPTGYFIEQWGQVPSVAASGVLTVSYPIAFPNACLSTVAVAGASSASSVPLSGVDITSGTPLSSFKTWNPSTTIATQPGLYMAKGY